MRIETYVHVSTPERDETGRHIRSRGTRLKVGDRVPDESKVTSFEHVHEVEPEDRIASVDEYVQLKVTDPGGGTWVYNLKLNGDVLTTPDGYVIAPMSMATPVEGRRG